MHLCIYIIWIHVHVFLNADLLRRQYTKGNAEAASKGLYANATSKVRLAIKILLWSDRFIAFMWWRWLAKTLLYFLFYDFRPARQKWLEVKLLIEKRNKALEQQKVVNQMHISLGEPVESPFPTPLMKPARPHLSAEDKEKVKDDLIKRFPNLPNRFVSW